MPSPPTNILEAPISFPEEVYIVGSGPENNSAYSSIPADAFIIVVNGAIECPLPCDPAIWMLSDPLVLKRKYFRENIEAVRTSGYDINPTGIQAGGPTIPVVDERTIWPHNKWIRTVYRNRRDKGLQEAGPFLKSHGTLRAGATIAGAAIQLAFYMGAKKMHLIGITLQGDLYFDGSHHDDADRKGNDWAHKGVFEWLVKIMRDIEHIEITNFKETVAKQLPVKVPDDPLNVLIASDFSIPSDVTILATGPNGKPHWAEIKPDDFVIAINGAIAIKDVKPNIWICADGNTTKRDYFKPGCIRCEAEGIKKVWSGAVRARAGDYNPDYVFRMMPDHIKEFRICPDRFQVASTVVGIAMELSYRFGAHKIKLCGVDMSGDKYFDGSRAPGNIDDAHLIIWDSRNNLDNEIEWMHRHGVRVSTMSETMLLTPHACYFNNLPSIAMLCMAFNPVFTKHAVFNASIQDYPNHRKALYLITQNGEQPDIKHDLPFKIVQSNVDGKWPELWLQKLMRFFSIATEDYVAIFDEDDFFEPSYLSTAINAIVDGNYRMVWTFENKTVTRARIVNGSYRSAFGTIVIEREIAFEVAKKLWRTVYGVDWPDENPNYKYGTRGAQDMNYQHMIIARLEKIVVENNAEFGDGKNIGLHNGVRWYCFHRNANTCSGRKDSDCIDYQMPGIWYSGTRFEKARYKKRDKFEIGDDGNN